MFALLKNKTHTAQEALRSGVMELQKAHVESASLDARLLLEHATGLAREQLIADMQMMLSDAQYAAYMRLIEARAARKPLAQLTGKREFWKNIFKVTHDTLDPRPDSEALIESVLARFGDHEKPLSLLDLGTGSGCLLLTLLKEYPLMQGVGVDISPAALMVAKENAMALGLGSRVKFVQSHWFAQVEGLFDLVISNPPYIATDDIARLAPEVALYEPKLALDGGSDGLDAYREIFAGLKARLKPEGMAFMEIGMGQQRDIESMAGQAGFEMLGVAADMAGIARCVVIKNI